MIAFDQSEISFLSFFACPKEGPRNGTPENQPLTGYAAVLGKVWAASNSLRFTPLKQATLFPQTSPPLLACFNGDSKDQNQNIINAPSGAFTQDKTLRKSIGWSRL